MKKIKYINNFGQVVNVSVKDTPNGYEITKILGSPNLYPVNLLIDNENDLNIIKKLRLDDLLDALYDFQLKKTFGV